MRSFVLPFGPAGWEEKKRALEDILSSRPRPPFLYNDILVLVHSSRMRRRYAGLFLEFSGRNGSAALVPPEVRTLHQFFQDLYAPLDGPLLMDENSRLVLLEGLVKERLSGDSSFPLSPDLLAPSLSSALAKMIEQLSGAGKGPEELAAALRDAEFSGKPQVRLLQDVYARYQKALRERNLTDPAGVRVYLRDRFDPSWIARYRTIFLDGVQDIDALEAGILKKIAACGDCTWFVDAPSAATLERAGEFHPLRIAKDSLGLIGIVPRDSGPSADAEQLFLASSLFSDMPFSEIAGKAPAPSSFRKKIRLLSAVNTREEVTSIADEVKRSLKRGTPADSILVTFPALDEYGPLVEEIFTDHGIPYNRALGRQLSASAVATAVVSLLGAAREEFSGPSLVRVFSSPFLKFGENPSLAPALDRLMRDRRMTGGKQKLLDALRFHTPHEGGTDVLTAPLNDLFDALGPFSARGAAPLSLWIQRLDDLIAWSGLGARVAAMHGPLNINLQAYKKLRETTVSLSRAGRLFSGYTYTFDEWFFLLKKTFMHTRFQVPPEDEGGVQVLGLEESPGHPWQEIYLGGLVDGKFPRRLPQNIFLPERTLESMGVRTLERSRLNAACHFYRLLLSAGKVMLIWPENEGDSPMVPSPFLEELTPLGKAGLLNQGVEKTSGIQFSLKIEDCHSLPELAKAVGLAGDVPGLTGVLNADLEGMAGIKSALEHMPGETGPVIAKIAKRAFRVTELDVYLNCPYDYYITNVLGIEPLEEVSEDISPMARGSKVHGVLRNFYLSWTGPVTRETRREAQQLLQKLADSAFDTEADTFRNRREKELFLTVMAGRFLDAEEEFWKQGMRPAYLEQKIERYPLVLANGEEVELSAKIDRIDVDENGNFIIVDYKTGKYPLPKMNVDQDIFQIPVYAVMARQSLSGQTPALKKPIGLAYYDLAGKTGAGARDVVLFNEEARNVHPSSKPKASPRTAGEFEEILEQSMDKARKAIEDIRAGVFPASPHDGSKCRYCPNEMMCEKEHN
jgi:ATP-dependent helicase/nuclease subunit B